MASASQPSKMRCQWWQKKSFDTYITSKGGGAAVLVLNPQRVHMMMFQTLSPWLSAKYGKIQAVIETIKRQGTIWSCKEKAHAYSVGVEDCSENGTSIRQSAIDCYHLRIMRLMWAAPLQISNMAIFHFPRNTLSYPLFFRIK